MSETTTPTTRSFTCDSCQGEIQIPFDLPPTTGPCPLCKATITSPPAPRGDDLSAQPIKLTAEEAPGKSSIPLKRTAAPGQPSGIPASEEEAAPAKKPKSASEGPKDELVEVAGNKPSAVPGQRGGDERVDVTAPADVAKKKRRIHPAIPFAAAVLIIIGVLAALVIMKRGDREVGPPVAAVAAGEPKKEMSEEQRRDFLKDGWKASSTDTLTGFLRAGTLENKAKFVIGGEAKLEEMREFYGEENEIDESDTPIELFSHFDLDIADKKRGLFLMQFERPAQYDIKEFFRPVAPLEVQHKIEEPGLLLSAFAARENFAMEPIRVMAFFREVENKLLLDWDVYAQTKYRALQHFIMNPNPGSSKVFRVMVRETTSPDPTAQGIDVSTQRYYRLSDPAHTQDVVDVAVPSDSTVGRILIDVAYINLPDKDPQNRYATVELGWTTDAEPKIVINEVICWEFLNLGGVAGNADPVDVAPEPADLDELGPDPLAPPFEGGSGEPVTAPVPGEEEIPGVPGEEPAIPGSELPAIPGSELPAIPGSELPAIPGSETPGS